MKLKSLLFLLLAVTTATVSWAQDGGVRGKVVSRLGREALSNVKVTLESTGLTVTTDENGNFEIENLPAGNHRITFTTPDFEELDMVVRVGNTVKDLQSVVVSPLTSPEAFDDQIFAELDMDSSSSDEQPLPSALSASKDVFTNIASYRFSEMRFNVRGYDSQYQDIYLNGIRFNDAMTGYGPWSLWSGLNDATRNQETISGLGFTDYGLGGIAGQTNINARASQMRKGLRVSVSNATQLYRFRVMVSYASGQLDNGWSYGFSVGTRQGGNGYVDGVYYNSYAYFGSVEKRFGDNHRLGLTIMASPTERGAQQASTEEAYNLFGNHYYNPNVGYQDGKLRNSRIRNTHEPIAMLTYTWDISERTRLSAATSLRFGKNGYSALSWKDSGDPRGDYYRYLPSYFLNQIVPGVTSDKGIYDLLQRAKHAGEVWTGMLDFDRFYRDNQYVDPTLAQYAGENQRRSNVIIEERHTDQLDYNFAANVAHQINNKMRIVGGVNLRANRTWYYDEIKDLLGGDYWYDIDKFAERDQGQDPVNYQNDLDYYNQNGHARIVREGDKFNYNYRAHLLEGSAWAFYNYATGGFSMNIGGEVGYSSMYREGLWCKGLFPDNSKDNSAKLNYLTYNLKGNFGYKFSGAHSLEASIVYMQNAPKFVNSFVSPRTRNTTTPGLTAENVLGLDLTYNLNLPYIKARLSGYYTEMTNQAKVISFYDDLRHSYTNFAMSGIDKRYYGVELGVSVPIWNGLSVVGALSWGDYTYTSDPNFVQTIDNSEEVVKNDRVHWEGMHVESSPQLAANIGLDFRGPRNWFASVNFNYYDKVYLSMNPLYRTSTVIRSYLDVLSSSSSSVEEQVAAVQAIRTMQKQEKFDPAFTLSASIGKNWYIHRQYMLGFSLEVKNLLNDQDIRTGGYEQMRLNRVRTDKGTQYKRFDSKYFYMLGTTYYLNVYFRF